MSKESVFFLGHILESIGKIEEFSNGLTIEKLLKDKLRQSAIIREIEVVGEAIKNLPIEFVSKYSFVPWAEFARMRDKLIHHYFGVNWEIVWKVIKDELPELKKKIQEILDKEEEKKETRLKKDKI